MMICMFGGFLSVYYFVNIYFDMVFLKEDDVGVVGEDLYLDKVRDFVDRLLGVFELFLGIFYVSVNLEKYKGILFYVDMGVFLIVEVIIVQFEFKYFVKLIGEKYFWDVVEKVMKVVDDNQVKDGFLFIFIYVISGEFCGENICLGS